MSDVNPIALALAPKKCKRIKRNGQPCGNWARRGQEVCGYHGGSAKHCLIAAERNLNKSCLEVSKVLPWVVEEAKRTGNLMPLIAACKLILEYAPGFGTATSSADTTRPELTNLSLEEAIARYETTLHMLRQTLEARNLADRLLGNGNEVIDAVLLSDADEGNPTITSTNTAPVTGCMDTDLPADGGLKNLHPGSEPEIQPAQPKENA